MTFQDLGQNSMTFQAWNPNDQIPWLSRFSRTGTNPVRMSGFFELQRHCVRNSPVVVQHSDEADCEAGSVICTLAAVDRLPVVLWSDRRCAACSWCRRTMWDGMPRWQIIFFYLYTIFDQRRLDIIWLAWWHCSTLCHVLCDRIKKLWRYKATCFECILFMSFPLYRWTHIHYEYRDLYINNTNTNWSGYKANHLGISKCRPVKLMAAPLLYSWYNELHTVTHCLEHASLITRFHVEVSEHRVITRTDCIQHSQRLFNMCIHQVDFW